MFRDSEFMRKVDEECQRIREAERGGGAARRVGRMMLLDILPFDEAAAPQFDDLRWQKLRIGSTDLRIAATALVNHAILLSASRSDFETVPGLRVENWLD